VDITSRCPRQQWFPHLSEGDNGGGDHQSQDEAWSIHRRNFEGKSSQVDILTPTPLEDQVTKWHLARKLSLLHTLSKVCTLVQFGSGMSPKSHVEGMVPRVVLLGGGGAFRRLGLMGGSEIIGGVPLKGIVAPSCLCLLCVTVSGWLSGPHGVNTPPLLCTPI
jgi:hypothetical protein